MSKDKQEKHDTTVRFGGRTIHLDVAVNTDEDIHVVIERVRVAAAGPSLRLTVIGASLSSGDSALPLWTEVAKAARLEQGRNKKS